MNEELVSLLFETHAFKVADADNPFWYTSGKLGPYFINVDYLYGSSEDSANLLSKIDNWLTSKEKTEIPELLYDEIMKQYDNNEIFKTVIDKLVKYIKENFELNLIDYISGGERRDWYFSIPVAVLLGKPHITIFKDLTTIASTCDFEESTQISNLMGKRILHVTDILNTGSSFERAWVPAINKLGSKINWAIYIVDRNQSGDKNLKELEVRPYSLLKLDEDLITLALNKNVINNTQFEMLKKYFEDPDGTMREFINSHPTFIQDVINDSKNEKSVKRAKLCLEKNWYGNTLGDE
ncbi:MAG: orotate phosphoribosyltransferase [Clostridia bacterium]|nr:orotate phosphoribosyltransferase [Clostridia bacterium]